MAKFKKGDRVRLVDLSKDVEPAEAKDIGLRVGAVGTVLEDDNTCPYIEWDGLGLGHDALFGDGRQTCWALREECLELIADEEPEEQKMQKMKFKKGDRVRLVKARHDNSKLKIGTLGTIYKASNERACVEWDNFDYGHDGDFGDDRHTCWVVYPDEVKKVDEAAPAADDGELAAAPSVFDALPQQLLAYAKLEGVRGEQMFYVPVSGAELRRLRDAMRQAQPAGKTGKKRRASKKAGAEKRDPEDAKVGDRVRVVQLIAAGDRYDVGMTGTVIQVLGQGAGYGARIKWDKPKKDNDPDSLLYLREFELIN